MDWKFLFLDPKGRIGRKDFWIGFAILFVAGIVLGLIPVIGQIISLLMLYLWVCLGSKRLHDMGKSGWLMVIPFGLQIVAAVVAMMAMGGAMMAGAAGGDITGAAAAGAMGGGLVAMLCALASLAFLIWIGATPGQPESNQYGAPPAPVVTAV